LTLSVKRGAFRAPAAEARMEAGKIGVLRINSLDTGEGADARARLQDLMKQGAQKIIIDLRSVAGGEIQEGVTVANLFIQSGSLARKIGRDQKVLNAFEADPKVALFHGPAVVLIDTGTAGAAEIVASAFLEGKRGDVVGEKSFGSGAEQELFNLRDGDGLLLTTVKWASGSGKPFLGEDRARSGVAPSVEVKRAEPVDTDDVDDAEPEDPQTPNPTATPQAPQPPPEDLQMKKAIELLRDKTPAQRAA
jgi:carboxyl-terminal processing protease